MSIVSIIDVSDAPQPPDRRGKALTRNIDAHTKRCRTCDRVLPFRCFVPTGSFIKSIGRKCGSADCRDCLARKRRAQGVPERHQRVNGRGEVWCNACKRYLPASEFRRHPARPHTWWSYCKPCVREIDRMRYRGSVATREGKRKVMDARTRRKRRQSAADFRERREFLAAAIELLRRRGLTATDQSVATQTTRENVYAWQRKQVHRPTMAVIARFEALLLLTIDWPQGEPAYRRRAPHPELLELSDAMRPVIARHPVRNPWSGGRRHRIERRDPHA